MDWRYTLKSYWSMPICNNEYAAIKISVDELQFGDIIGSGNFGKVYKGVWNGTTVALKSAPATDPTLLPTPKFYW